MSGKPEACEKCVEGELPNGDACQECCEHHDLDDCICLDCGKDNFENMLSAAYDIEKDLRKYGDT